MKHLIVTVFLFLLLFSCKKENNLPMDSIANNNATFFQTIKIKLKDSLSISDYAGIDTNRLYKSKDVQSKGCFVRIGLLNKSIATDFILLKTDTLGNIKGGKIIHVDKDKLNVNKTGFSGRFAIATLDRTSILLKTIVNGKFKPFSSGMDLMEADPAVGEQTLPDCVITCYSTYGNDEGDWYCYNAFYDDNSGGGGGGYTYGYSGGGGTSSNGANEDATMIIKVESNDEPAVKVDDYLKCFSTLSDLNANYQITIFSDIPVNGQPLELFNTETGSVGHSFIQLRKTNEGASIQQTIGFYPATNWKSLMNLGVESKIVDNAGHEYNASLTTTVSGDQFQAELNEIRAIEGRDYNITSWNCTDFALDIFNAGSIVPLTIPLYQIPRTESYSSTPQALYVTIQKLQVSNDDSYGTTEIPGVFGWVGSSHGSCGN